MTGHCDVQGRNDTGGPSTHHADMRADESPDRSGGLAWDQSLGLTTSLGRVLVVSNDVDLRKKLATFLQRHRGEIVEIESGSWLGYLERESYGLMVVDFDSLGPAGFAMLGRIRMLTFVPLILLTDKRRADIDYVVGLELGADDVLVHPFEPRTLLTRARAILRRQEIGRSLAGSPTVRGFRFDGWELHHKGRCLRDANGGIIDLSKREFSLLTCFLEAPQRPLSRLHLMRATRMHEDIFDRSIDVQILRLRRKLEANPSARNWIKTVRGIGYRFEARVETLF